MPVQKFSGGRFSNKNKDVVTYHWEYHAPDIAFGDGSINVTYDNLGNINDYHNQEKYYHCLTFSDFVQTKALQLQLVVP